jgi:hypothetical protein
MEKTDPLKQYVDLDHERRRIDDRLAQIKKEQAALSEILIEDWAERGQQNAQVDGLTVYISHDFFCSKSKGFTSEEVCGALRAVGLADMCSMSYSASSLKAWVKEQLKLSGELPEQLDAVIQHGEVPRLRTQKT